VPRARRPAGERAGQLARAVRERDAVLRDRVLPVVDLFVAPSRFLSQSFAAWGVPAERLYHMRTGIDLDGFRDVRRSPSKVLRVAFIGTVVEHKGVHVLLGAWSRLPAKVRARARLTIHGPLEHQPDYVARVRSMAQDLEVELSGRLQRDEVPTALADTDLLVVPSVWYENSPLIILEALATRTPLLVSDLGGMAELVEQGVTGYHFRAGDPADLAVKLAELVADPARLSRLYPEGQAVRDVGEDAHELIGLYTAALTRRGRQPS
jgi:glycosyltransferase involved in cell wall biosynthesis